MKRLLFFVLLSALFLVTCPFTSDVDTTTPFECCFYNQMEFDDPAGDALPAGAASYVDIVKLTVRQYGQYVQFTWEANGNPLNNEDQYYFLIFDTDLNPETGQHWNGAGGEFKICVYQTAHLIYFDAEGNVTNENDNLPVVFEGNTFYLNVELGSIPSMHFNLYFESSGSTVYYDLGTMHEVRLAPQQEEVRLVIEADEMMLPDNPPLINIPEKLKPLKLCTYLVHNATKRLLEPGAVEYSVYHPVPRIVDPSSIISVSPEGLATYRQEGYVFVTARLKPCSIVSKRTILATGIGYGDPGSDNVLAVFPPDYIPPESMYSFGQMIAGYKDYIRTINIAYNITSGLYNGFKPYQGEKQIFALLVLPGHCGGNNNPLETAPCCYMNCNDGTPQYNVAVHEMGHNFATARGMLSLTEANGGKIGNAGFRESVASLPVIYSAWEFYDHPEECGIARNSFEWSYYQTFIAQDIPYAMSQFNNFEESIRSGRTKGIFDNNGFFDGIAVLCSFFQSYAYNFTKDANPYGNEVIKRFLHLFDDSELPAFREDHVETYFSAAFSVAAGNDVREKLRFWGFTINDAYYDQIYPLLMTRLL